MNVSGSKPLGTSTQRVGSRPSSSSARATWVSESTIMRSQPAAHARMRSAHAAACAQRPGSAAIASSISSSVPCRWPTTGTPGATRAAASWIGVRWCRCSTSARAAPTDCSAPAPRDDLALVLLVVERGEDAVRRARAVLVGGVHRRVGAHRVRRAERRGHVDRPHVEPGVELARVARLAGARERSRQHRHVPACAAERVARLRATCAEPPRGKKASPITARRRCERAVTRP